MEKLNKALRELRKIGYEAKRHFWCCNSCGSADFFSRGVSKFVFMHQQAEEAFKKSGKAYFAWEGDGQEIVDVFEKNGLIVDWNGTEERKIVVEVFQK